MNITYRFYPNNPELKYVAWEQDNSQTQGKGKTLEEAIGKLILKFESSFKITNELVTIEEKLIALQIKAKEDYANKVTTFKERIKAEIPLDDWAKSKIKEGEAKLRDTEDITLERWSLNNDNNCHKYTDEEFKKVSTLLDNEEVTVVGYHDYDFECSLCKFTVTSKLTKLKVRHSVIFKYLT